MAPQGDLWGHRYGASEVERMGFTRALRAVGGAVLAGAMVLAVAPSARADVVRDAQWPLTEYGAKADVWPSSTGKGVTVAVIDSGVRATHVDLTGQVLPGTDFAFGGNGETDHSSEGHGTGIASLIAGHGHGPNDEDGVMGLAPDAKILPIGVNPGGSGADHLAQAIRYAVDHGATVINMSLGDALARSDADYAAVAYAEAHNVVVVAAAGNNGASEDDYPASYPGVVSVGAVDKNAQLWSGSNSSSHLTVVAPGVDIVVDGAGSNTETRKGDGTSMATAYVSAIAALIRSAYPKLTQGQVVDFIIKGAKVPAGVTVPDVHWGYGIARPNQFDKWKSMAPGAAAGPLPQATESAAAAPARSISASPSAGVAESGSSSPAPLIVGVVVVLLLLIVLLVVLSRRRRRRNRGGSGGPGGGAGGSNGLPPGPAGYGAQPSYQQQPQAYQPPYQPPHQPPQPSVYQNNPYAQPPQQAPQPPNGPQGPYAGGSGTPG